MLMPPAAGPATSFAAAREFAWPGAAFRETARREETHRRRSDWAARCLSSDGATITEAMRYGAARDYDPDDLGKFGLGLKTASMSQCRRLTVASRSSRKIACPHHADAGAPSASGVGQLAVSRRSLLVVSAPRRHSSWPLPRRLPWADDPTAARPRQVRVASTLLPLGPRGPRRWRRRPGTRRR